MDIALFKICYLIVLCCANTLAEEDLNYPKWLKILVENPEYKGLSGFYKKLQTSRPIYKKPRTDIYLSLFNGSWNIGENLKGDEILLLDSNCPLPTTSTCDGIWKDIDENVTDVIVEAEPHLTYPKFYQLKGDGIFEENLRTIIGYYEKISHIYKGYPTYRKSSEPFFILYLHMNGQWTISFGANRQRGLVRSSTRALPSPSYENIWSYWNKTKYSWDNSSINVVPFQHPESYMLAYEGQDVSVRAYFERENLEGYYLRDNVDDLGNIYYVKDDGVPITLSINMETPWTIFKPSRGILFQPEPSPEPSEQRPWFLKIEDNFTSTPGIVLRPCIEEKTDETYLVICISVSISVSISVFILVMLCVCVLVRRRRKAKAGPGMEENDYYGCEEEYYNEYNSRIEDKNTYYRDDTLTDDEAL